MVHRVWIRSTPYGVLSAPSDPVSPGRVMSLIVEGTLLHNVTLVSGAS